MGDLATTRYATRAMGSPLRATIVRVQSRRADHAWERLVTDVERTEAALSRFRAESALSQLNRTAGDGAWHTVDARLHAMAAMAARAWHHTGGRFDARILRRLEALGEHAGVALPGLERGAQAEAPDVERCGIERQPRTRALRIADPLDSGGLGKGLALRWAARAALAVVPSGTGLLIEAGGDVVVSGPQPDGGAWRIGIEDPAGGEEPMAVLELADGAVATSSTALRRWTGPDGRAVHHLIDPRTGEPADRGLLAVTVVHGDPAWAETWSKALFLAGSSSIGPEARRRGLASWWVRVDGSLEMTPAARALTIWERAAARRRSA
jgi:thiamine biosynthesis lipoprotein